MRHILKGEEEGEARGTCTSRSHVKIGKRCSMRIIMTRSSQSVMKGRFLLQIDADKESAGVLSFTWSYSPGSSSRLTDFLSRPSLIFLGIWFVGNIYSIACAYFTWFRIHCYHLWLHPWCKRGSREENAALTWLSVFWTCSILSLMLLPNCFPILLNPVIERRAT